jgi:hypothetical protein
LSRAGVAKNRSRTSIRVPQAPAAGVRLQQEGAVLTLRTAADGQPADAGKRRQRLATEAERPDPHQVVVRQLGGGMALDRQGQLVRRHADAVVGDRDQRPPAAGELDHHARGAGVEGVLDQLLDRRCGPLDDLAGGDPVDQALGQTTDRGHEAGAPEALAGIIARDAAADKGGSCRGGAPDGARYCERGSAPRRRPPD